MMQLNQQLINSNDQENTEGVKDGFEILEINNGTDSPTHKSDSIIPKTPVKYSQSESKATSIRKLNFDFEGVDDENNEPRRRQRNIINIHDNSDNSLSSLEVSKLTEEKEEDIEKDLTITISPPPLKDCSKGTEYERISKELGIETHSPEDDFEINEKDLDENYNMNWYSDEELEKVENNDQGINNYSHNLGIKPTALKSYYLKQSQYLSGITEQSVEESEYFTSFDKAK